MTKEQAQQLWPVIKAFMDGCEVQRRILDKDKFDDWQDQKDPEFDNPYWEWRVKPKPREFWVVVNRATLGTDGAYWQRPTVPDSLEVIHVKEVL